MAKGLWIILAIIAVLAIGGVVLFMQRPASNNQPAPPPANNLPANNPPITENPKEYSVSLQGFAFSPSTLTIKKGDTVTWTNLDSIEHTVTSDSGNELDSALLSKGQAYSHTFDTAGTFGYYCIRHPNMKAKIIVE